MTGFEPRTSGVGSDRSTNWATTTAQMLRVKCDIPRRPPTVTLHNLSTLKLDFEGNWTFYFTYVNFSSSGMGEILKYLIR